MLVLWRTRWEFLDQRRRQQLGISRYSCWPTTGFYVPGQSVAARDEVLSQAAPFPRRSMACLRALYNTDQSGSAATHGFPVHAIGGSVKRCLCRNRRTTSSNKGGHTVLCINWLVYTGVYIYTLSMHAWRSKHKHVRRLVDKLSPIPFFQFSIELHVYVSMYLHTLLWLFTAAIILVFRHDSSDLALDYDYNSST